MALQGNLRDFSTTQLLNLISLARKTGTLVIEGPTEHSMMAFREGRLVFAQLGNTPDDGSLATILQKQGKISPKQAEALRQRSRQISDKELGLLLINAGYLTQNDILQSVRQYILDVAYRLFTWVEGMFKFEADKLPGDDRITVSIALDNVILEGTRRVREWERLQEEIPSLDMALRFTTAPKERLKTLNLSVEEWKVVSNINPKNTMRMLAKAHNLNDTEIRRIVYGLLQAGIVEIVRPDGVPARKPNMDTRTGRAAAKQVEATRDKSLVNRLIKRIQSL